MDQNTLRLHTALADLLSAVRGYKEHPRRKVYADNLRLAMEAAQFALIDTAMAFVDQTKDQTKGS